MEEKCKRCGSKNTKIEEENETFRKIVCEDCDGKYTTVFKPKESSDQEKEYQIQKVIQHKTGEIKSSQVF